MFNKIYKTLFVTSFSEKKILIKDLFFTSENENIIRTIRSIKKIGNNLDSIIIDIGAFNGETAIQFTNAFPKSKVYAFEANPEMFDVANKKCSQHQNISLINCAISDKNDFLDFYVTHNNVSSSLNEINRSDEGIKDYGGQLDVKNKLSVKAVPLDKYTNFGNVLLIKIDTQGHELKVIAGASEILKKTKFVLIEMANHNLYKNGCKYYEIDSAMRDNNFELFDMIVTYRKNGIQVSEYDAIYINKGINE